MSNSTHFDIPLNVITKIISEAIPDELEVHDDFIKALSRATSLFILYSTTRANQVASENSRRSVYSQDVLTAISSLGFDHLLPNLINWHSMYMEEEESHETDEKPDFQVE
ncbi:hypothetical protein BLOT_001694 [Blomia tropicalis]|nr:hypothetical protein BLOT_001694 [Blomia tropicalis]